MADEDAEALRPVGQVNHNGKGKRSRCGVRDGASCCWRYKATPVPALMSKYFEGPGMY